MAILQYLRQQPEGDTLTGVRDATGLGRRTGKALHRLQSSCQIESASVETPAGSSGTRSYPGYRLIQNDSAENAEDDSPGRTTDDPLPDIEAT